MCYVMTNIPSGQNRAQEQQKGIHSPKEQPIVRIVDASEVNDKEFVVIKKISRSNDMALWVMIYRLRPKLDNS